MKNRGFTVYELLISFAFLAIIGYSMLSMILSLKDKAYLT
jgi:type II secretory pathway component PulJ